MFKNPQTVNVEGQRNIMKMCVELHLHKSSPDGNPLFAKPLEWLTEEETKTVIGEHYAKPALSFKYDEAQALMDELYRCGVRPTDVGTAGQLDATRAHLKDMQLIAMSFVKQHTELLK